MDNEWLNYIHSTTAASGRIETKNDLILEWKKSDILSPDLADFKKSICEFASKQLAPIELEFLQAHPESAAYELFLRPCVPLLENGADWKTIEEKIQATIQQFYLMDLSKFGPEIIKSLLDDVYFFATLKNKKDELLGFILFAVTPALPYGNIKVINLLAHQSGLEKTLLSCIFTLLPQTKRVFLFVRPTNKNALQMYLDMDFTQDLEPLQDPNHKINTKYLIPLEYKTEQKGKITT